MLLLKRAKEVAYSFGLAQLVFNRPNRPNNHSLRIKKYPSKLLRPVVAIVKGQSHEFLFFCAGAASTISALPWETTARLRLILRLDEFG
jgi:hypothetical protein